MLSKLKVYVLLVILLTSCQDVKSPVSIVEKAAPVSMTGRTESDFTVYYKKSGYKPSKAEPPDGCYTGSYVLSNKRVDGSMVKFDELVGNHHAISVCNMRLGAEYPYEWVLESVAAMKTPYIIVYPPDEYAVFKEELIEDAAERFSVLNVPIFVDFYPNPSKYTTDSYLYKDFYKKAYNIFKQKAPNVIFVLSVDSEQVYDFDFYYPGDEYVDWVGISLYVPLYKNGQPYTRNYIKDLDYFYSSYQRRKPMVVSQLAISGYSTHNHRYFSKEASKKLEELYNSLKNEYTRIKAVNYIDFNNIDGAPKNAVRDNFSITQNEIMLNCYKQIVSDDYFLDITTNESSESIPQLFKSYFPVLEDENSKYINERVFSLELLKTPTTPPIVINGERYYNSQLIDGEVKCTIDYEQKNIVLE